MVSHGKWIAGLTLGVLGGCFASYGYNDFDGKGTGGEGGAGSGVSASSVGASISSSGPGGMGGMGGAGGTGACDDVVCDNRPKGCPVTNCPPLGWAHRAGNAEQEQNARSVAISPMGNHNVAIAGAYQNGAFSTGLAADPMLPGSIQPGNFTEGFVALYDGKTGAPLWARNLRAPAAPVPQSFREARSVAFDANGFLVVAGVEGTDQTINHFFLQKLDLGSANSPAEKWTQIALGGESTYTEAVAVATSGTNTYLLGRSLNSSSSIICPASDPMPVQLEQGMFVAKFADNGSCIWLRAVNAGNIANSIPTAMTAKNAGINGVWITGTIINNIALGPLALDPLGKSKPFVIRLSDTDGTPTAAYMYESNGGKIQPMAMDADVNGNIFVSGALTGPTQFSPSFNATEGAGFVLQIKPDSSPANPYASIANPILFSVTGKGLYGGRASGVAWDQDKLYVAGTFAGTLNTPTEGVKLQSVDANGNGVAMPFLAVFDTKASADPLLVALDGFPGGNTSLDQSSIFLAGQNIGLKGTSVAVTGGWIHDLDFTTVVGTVDGLLTGPTNPTNADAFVAKFGP